MDADRRGNLDQLALVTQGDAIDIRVFQGIDLRIHPERGLDIGAAWFRGLSLGWISPAGEGGTGSTDWTEAWGGGLLTTCGLDNVGRASEGIGLHGGYTFLAARDVEVVRTETEVVCRGTIDDPRGLLVERTITTSIGRGQVELVDTTRNTALEPLPAPLLYHVNLGWPLWDAGARIQSDAREVVPRDDDAAPHDWSPAPEPADVPERVWEHVGASAAALVNDHLGVRIEIESSLPRLWQWVAPSPGFYALALEPANCSVLGRAHDRAAGDLPMLEPGEERVTSIVISAASTI
jgi:Domain of unknown function (DUF4432)